MLNKRVDHIQSDRYNPNIVIQNRQSCETTYVWLYLEKGCIYSIGCARIPTLKPKMMSSNVYRITPGSQ